MTNNNSFKRKLIASVVASSALAGLAGGVHAQGADEPMLEEIVVTGIRASLTRAMDVKRDSRGIVDAIAAEDIGKFPDTNLAESLQRITGVSIDRSNNEGSKITVRGFGPDYNLVLLNGRQMPSVGDSRSFEFGDVAAEIVSGVEVHKTFSADNVTGGIGSMVNIKTARPLDNPGLNFSIGTKAMMDTTNETGDDVTPEVAAIISNTFADDTFGAQLALSYQERDSRLVNADIANWRNNFHTDAGNIDMSLVEDNRADPDGPTFYPRNFGYGIDDISRDRLNGQAVLQFAPTEKIEATLDYTFVDVDYEALNTGVGIWFSDTGDALTDGVIDENGTFVSVTEAGQDYASNIRRNTSETELDSVGLNVSWDVSENLALTFDAHDSSRLNQGVGRGNDAFLILGAVEIDEKTYDATGGEDIPFMHIDFLDDGAGIVDGVPTAASYDSLFAQSGININESDVQQFQLNGVWTTNENSGLVSIDFGAAHTEIANRWRSFNTGQLPLGWYSDNHELWPEDMFTALPTAGLFPSFSGGETNVPVYHTWDFERGVAIAEQQWADHSASPLPDWGTAPEGTEMRADTSGSPVSDHRVTEETMSAYVQFNLEGELSGMPLQVVSGLRYEATDIVSNSYQQDPLELVWQNPTEWGLNLAEESTYTNRTGDYEVFLPSVDAALDIREDVVGRFSFSQSITRPTLGSMIGTRSVTDRPKPGERSGTQGNPNLRPFTSNNLDLSFEWYYDDASYASVGLFVKKVDNFIVDQFVSTEVLNLRDPLEGPRAQQAREELAAEGAEITDETVFDRINENQGTEGAITQVDADPLAPFEIATPSNMEEATLQGAEFAVQHNFSETGFGVIANLTLVAGDLSVDNSSTDFQFVLPGLSDSANLIAFYDKNGLQARIAYNWRDSFLNGVGQNNTPIYTEEYGQVDVTVSYDLPFFEGLTVFAEGINVTDESQRQYARYENMFKHAEQYGARYNIGARYTF